MMSSITIFGMIAGTLTTLAFLPQVIKTWKLKETKDISLWTYLILSIGLFFWMTYGIMLKDFPLIAANSISFFLSCIILFFKIKYK